MNFIIHIDMVNILITKILFLLVNSTLIFPLILMYVGILNKELKCT